MAPGRGKGSGGACTGPDSSSRKENMTNIPSSASDSGVKNVGVGGEMVQ